MTACTPYAECHRRSAIWRAITPQPQAQARTLVHEPDAGTSSVCDCQLPLLVSGTLNRPGKAVRLAALRRHARCSPAKEPTPRAQRTHIPFLDPSALGPRPLAQSLPHAHTPAHARDHPHPPTAPFLPSSFGSSHQTPLNLDSSTHSSSQQHHSPSPPRPRPRRASPPQTHSRPPRRRLLLPPALVRTPKSASGHPRHQSRVVRTGYCNIGRIPIIDVNASAPAPAPKPALVAHISPVSTTTTVTPPPITASQSAFIDPPRQHRPTSRRQRAHTLAPTPP